MREERTFITKDDDFIRLHNQWLQKGKEHFGIFFCPFRDKPTIGLIVSECLYYFQAIENGVGTIVFYYDNQAELDAEYEQNVELLQKIGTSSADLRAKIEARNPKSSNPTS